MGLPISGGSGAASPNEGAFNADNTPFDAIGGLERVRELVDRFYRHMGEDAARASTRALYPEDVQESREKLYEFLVGWLGGPPLYINKYGHPRLRGRHLPFAIGTREHDDWLACMNAAMDEMSITGDLRAFLDQRFTHVANFMRNRDNSE